MAEKVWSLEQRSEAWELVEERFMREPNRKSVIMSLQVVATEIQCELTDKDSELTEAVELIRLYEDHRAGRVRFFPDFHRVTEFLQRNTGGA